MDDEPLFSIRNRKGSIQQIFGSVKEDQFHHCVIGKCNESRKSRKTKSIFNAIRFPNLFATIEAPQISVGFNSVIGCKDRICGSTIV